MTSGFDYIAEANSYTYRGYRYDSEINMYYLNSRYYNPEIGRFISSDGYFGQQGDILSTNMFAYAANNPVYFIDPSGYWVISIVGFTFQASGYLAFSISVWWVIDSKGNQGLLITAGSGIGSPSVSVTWSPFFSWRKTIYDLSGLSIVAGGSIDLGLSGGVELMFDKNGPLGITLNLGLGISGAEGHLLGCVTALIPFRKNYRASRSDINRIINSIRSFIQTIYT